MYGVRLELPFALDHVNIWLFAETRRLDRDRLPGWPTSPRASVGTSLRRGLLADRPIRRVLATHYHPDHMGLAGWLCAETGAELWTSRTEWLLARLYAQDVSDECVAAGRRFDRRAGLDAAADRGAGGAGQPLPPPGGAAAGVVPPGARRRPAAAGRRRVGGDRRPRPCSRDDLSVQRRTERADRRRSGPAQDLAERQRVALGARGQPARRFPAARSRAFASCRRTAWCCPRTGCRFGACTRASTS